MKSELLVSPSNELFQRWRRQFVVHRRRHSLQARPLAALSFFTRRPIADPLVPVDELVLVVLYDAMAEGRSPAIHLAGFAGGRVPWGVVWGGRDCNKFSKDLSLPPAAGACGRQLDLERPWLLQFGLQLDSYLSRCCDRTVASQIRQPQLPKLWAGFAPADGESLTPEGPEIDGDSRHTGIPAEALLADSRRAHHGLALFPLEWVSHRLERAKAVFADLGHFPKRQVFVMQRLPDDLQGFNGCAEFDFAGDRFQPAPMRPRLPCVRAS